MAPESLAALWARMDHEATLLSDLPALQAREPRSPLDADYLLLRAIQAARLWCVQEATEQLRMLAPHQALLASGDRRAELHYLLCTNLINADRPDEAVDALTALTQVHQHHPGAFTEACLCQARARLACIRGEFELVEQQARRALACFDAAGVCRHAANVCTMLRHAAEHDGRRADSLQYMRHAVAMSRQDGNPVAACNAMTGLVECLARDGELAEAEQIVEQAYGMLEPISRLPGDGAFLLPLEVRAAEAFLREKQGRTADAMRLLREVADVYLTQCRGKRRFQASRRLRDLSDMQARTGLAVLSRATVCEAYELRLAEMQDSHAHSLEIKLERQQRQHAEAAAELARAHAAMLERANLALQESLNLQREMQHELIEQSRLGALGALLAGIAHEMNTPLGNALTTLSTVAQLPQQLLAQMQAGTLGRSQLVQAMETIISSSEVTLRNLQRVASLMSEYSTMELPVAALPAPVDLAAAIAPAWREAMAGRPDIRLELNAGPPLCVNAAALDKILLQLFCNVARHAYPAGRAGTVRVSSGETGDRGWLRVEDDGPGIAPALLPRVFDPYVSGTFGQGRNGLGLFQAQAAAWRQLKGRITAQNLDAGGCRFELQWLLPPRQEPALNLGGA